VVCAKPVAAKADRKDAITTNFFTMIFQVD